MNIQSPAFQNKEKIPTKYTCEGENISPPLDFIDVPPNTKSLVLIVEDPDAPESTFTHWLLWNISPEVNSIPENSQPSDCITGKNDAGRTGYTGPCPPSGTHRYFFKLYALDAMLDIPLVSTKDALEEELTENILAYSELIGTYSKNLNIKFSNGISPNQLAFLKTSLPDLPIIIHDPHTILSLT